MPAEFLRDSLVDRTQPTRRLSMLPISIVVHALAALACFIIPLAAEVEPPAPAPRPLHDYMPATPLPPAPPPPRPATAARLSDTAAPTEAPTDIVDEVERAPAGPVAIGAIPAGTPGLGDTPGALGSPLAVLPPLPPPPLPPAPIPVGGAIRAPKKIVDVAPIYPALARSARVQGKVILEAVINERGVVERLKVLRSQPLLDEAAIAAVRQWRYTPTLLNGAPVAVLISITINFTLDGGSPDDPPNDVFPY
jgi:periplasmic protein TonB